MWSDIVVLAEVALPVLTGWGASGFIDWLKARGVNLEGETAYWVSLIVAAVFGVITALLTGIVMGDITDTSFGEPLRIVIYVVTAMFSSANRYAFKARREG